MPKIAVLGGIQEQADALSTQFQPIHVLFNDRLFIRNRAEMRTSDAVIYEKYSALNLRQEIFALRRLLKRIGPDVIYINGLTQLWIVGLIIREPGLFRKRPVLLATSHNSWAWKKARQRLLIALSCRLFADGVFPLASFQERGLKRLGVPSLRMRTIGNGVDIGRFDSEGPGGYFADVFPEKENFPVLVSIATIEQTKGQETLVRAVRLVKKEIDTVRLVLMGLHFQDSPYERHLKGLIGELGLERNVLILGNIEHRQIPTVLRSSDISVVSSWNEVCPFSLLESLAAGRVTISTAVGGIPDIIQDGLNGFLVNPGDAEAFADRILRVIKDPSLKTSVERRARISAIENYSYDVIGRKHRDFLASILRWREPGEHPRARGSDDFGPPL